MALACSRSLAVGIAETVVAIGARASPRTGPTVIQTLETEGVQEPPVGDIQPPVDDHRVAEHSGDR